MPAAEAISSANIVFTERKTICLTVNRMGEVVIRAPIGTSLEKIEAFAAKNEAWLLGKVAEQQQRMLQCKKLQGTEGESFLFLGRDTTIETIGQCSGTAKLRAGKALLPPSPKPLAALVSLVKSEAAGLLEKRLKDMGKRCGLPYKGFRVSWAKRRWGSCSASNVINLSWRLAMCPQELIDYVIVHELCHTIHKDHSAAFWREVNSRLPNATELRKQLVNYEFVMEYFD
ncbi:MAG: M48 family metallopeptidase [Eubacteriaceae bacterium]|jgi:predicted metal-dependent hydrolase|nr:M48 family metallopeptidase [Eubacteriaceae bacterium]